LGETVSMPGKLSAIGDPFGKTVYGQLLDGTVGTAGKLAAVEGSLCQAVPSDLDHHGVGAVGTGC